MNAQVRRWVVAGVLLGGVACSQSKSGKSSPGGASSAASAGSSAAPNAPGPSSSSAPAASSSAPSAPASPPVGGVASWESIESLKECSPHNREIDPNLAHGSLGVAAKGKDLAVTRLLRSESRGEGQLAFGGYDNQTRSIATSHGLGKAQLKPGWVFPRKEDWTVFWFDAQGLVFTRAGWSPVTNKIGRFSAIPLEESDRVALLSTSLDGPMVGVSPLSVDAAAQLGIFLFVPGESLAEIVKVVGATHHASKPKHPAVAASADGYFLAWVDEPDGGKPTAIAATRFDNNGKEIGPQISLSTPGRAARQPSVAVTEAGLVVAWVEKNGDSDEVVAQTIPRGWQLSGPAQRVDKGSAPVLHATKSGAVLVFLRQNTDGKGAHAAAVHVGADGKLAPRGMLLSQPDKPKDSIAERPGLAVNDDGWLGAVFTFSDGMRSQLRTARVDCLAPASPAPAASSASPAPAASSASPAPAASPATP